MPPLDGLELGRIEARLRNRLRLGRAEAMTDLEGLERSSLEARIEYLIQQRVAQHGENRQFAELQVTRTEEGRALWNRVRKLRLAESAESGSSGSAFSHIWASLISQEARLENLIALRMSESGETRDTAERAIVHTAEGLELWERVRALKLAESRDED
jgi:hypothetical protein